MLRGSGWAAIRTALLVATLLVGALLVPPGARAQEAGSGAAILTLDQDRFFLGSAFGKAALAREAAATKALSAENLRIEQALEAEERNLTTRRSTLPADEFAELAVAFDARVEQIRTEQDAKSRSISRTRDADRQRFLQSAVPVLGELLSEKGGVAILDKGAIILSLSAIDVTDAAIARVDAVLGDGSRLPLPGETPPETPPTDPGPTP